MIIKVLFDEIKWGSATTTTEYEGLQKLGKAISFPYQMDINETENYKRLSIDLASSIVCAFVYKNNSVFRLKALKDPLQKALANYMITSHVIKFANNRYEVTNYAIFEKWLVFLCNHQLPDTYKIITASNTYTVNFDVLSKVYADNEPFVYTVGLGTVHPMISHKLTNFINQTNCFTADGVLAIRTMLDGLAKHNGYNPPLACYQR